MAIKTVSITFPTGSYKLDENSKSLIDLQFADVARGFANARVRIEGNTDNVGDKLKNIELSRKRAESVAQYLQSTYSCLLYTSPSPRDRTRSRMPSSA